MNSTAVLFDLDGTLTDSRPGILSSLRHAFARLGESLGKPFPLPSDEELRWVIGPPLRVTFARLAGVENVEALIGFYRDYYGDIGAWENQVYDGIPEALDALQGAGVKLFVATSKNERIARPILEYFGLADRFLGIHGSRNDGGYADKTELIRYVLESHRLAPTRTAMIGDREFDMIGACNNHVAALGALWGYGGAVELQDAGAAALLETPDKIFAAVAKALG